MAQGLAALVQKIRRRVKSSLIKKTFNTPLQFALYPSYWHFLLVGKKNPISTTERYLTQKPNYGAGIGHQLANWNSGYFYAPLFYAKFAHCPFSEKKWEDFLGFYVNEPLSADLIENATYKKVQLPPFDGENPTQVTLVRNIVSSYSDAKILFSLEQDQSYMRQCDTYLALSDKFFNAPARKEDKLIYDKDAFSIALHIRRGDIVQFKEKGISNWKDRWLDNDYYAKVLDQVLSLIQTTRKVNVYLFSQGEESDFPEFQKFTNIQYCLQMNAINSFLHMAYADMLITSKSSFSYKPALISKGIKLCPSNFWHSYPDSPEYVLVDDESQFDRQLFMANATKWK